MHTTFIRSNRKEIKAVIIDLDGTMIDTAPDFLVAINRMRSNLSLAPIDLDLIKLFIGKGSENLIRRVLALDFDDARQTSQFTTALASYQHHYAIINGKQATLFSGVREGLLALSAMNLRLACVTNKPIAMALSLLEQNSLRSFFEIVYGGDSLPTKKPDPAPFLKVCADFAVLPRQVVVIGDSSNDAQAARAAGCSVLCVPYGYNHGEPIQNINCDGIVATLLDAADLIAA
ncbi:MAG: phosphoglycolate phosphatase [Pseudomonadota bacterium]